MWPYPPGGPLLGNPPLLPLPRLPLPPLPPLQRGTLVAVEVVVLLLLLRARARVLGGYPPLVPQRLQTRLLGW